MRKVRYNVASSLDGFIAGPNGEHDWIIMDPGFDFRAFFDSIDTVLVGRNTYEAAKAKGPARGMPGKKSIVYSTTLKPEQHGDLVIHADAKASVAELKAQQGKDIWIMGGSGLFRSLLEARLIDSIEIALVPVLLGAGVPLMPGPFADFKLKLTASRKFDSGLVMLTYEPAPPGAKASAVH